MIGLLVVSDVLRCLKAESGPRQLVASFHLPDKRIGTFSQKSAGTINIVMFKCFPVVFCICAWKLKGSSRFDICHMPASQWLVNVKAKRQSFAWKQKLFSASFCKWL
jgi:hypothetical protein